MAIKLPNYIIRTSSREFSEQIAEAHGITEPYLTIPGTTTDYDVAYKREYTLDALTNAQLTGEPAPVSEPDEQFTHLLLSPDYDQSVAYAKACGWEPQSWTAVILSYFDTVAEYGRI